MTNFAAALPLSCVSCFRGHFPGLVRAQHPRRDSGRNLQSHSESSFEDSPASCLTDSLDSALHNRGQNGNQSSSPDRAQDHSTDCSSDRHANRTEDRSQMRPEDAF